jgi:P-type Mg2+ transporter
MSKWDECMRHGFPWRWSVFAKVLAKPVRHMDAGEVDRQLREARLRTLAMADATAIYQALGSAPAGLTETDAAARLRELGLNTASREETHSVPVQLLQKLRNPLNILLLLMATLSVLGGNVASAIIIAVMVVLSTSLSFLQEHRSNRAVEALRRMVHTTATVSRRASPETASPAQAADGDVLAATHEIPLEQLVPGDIVHLAAGDMVPADVRLLSARGLFVNEAPLTGEAMPVEKNPRPLVQPVIEAMRIDNVCFMGTNVVSGTAVAIVVYTGPRAVFGGIAQAIAGERALTSFDRGISRFTWLMISLISVMAPLVFLINGLTKGNWMEALLFATAVAVGLTPEMLPTEVTINLGKGALAMSRKRVIVKRLDAIQNFGAMDVLCTDKTGTLTQDLVILERHVDLQGNESERVLDYAYLNSYYQSGLKNLLDVAVLKYTEVHSKLHASGGYHKVDEIPFDFERRRMSVVVDGPDGRTLICKGAVEEVFSVCTHGEADGGLFDLDDSHWHELRKRSSDLNEDGLRLIAIAYAHVDAGKSAFGPEDERELILLGYIAFLDPPKDSAREALARLARHGVAVKILTGDNDVVARKICKEVGLTVSDVLLGSDLAKLSPAQLEARVETCQLFARLAPLQKAMVIDALRRSGHVVGYLGDGINDGPALKAADVGVSVDTAVDIARETADIILLEKSLLILDDGVIEGRKVFANILKYIRMGASSNFGNMFSVLGASAWLPFLPMAPLQVLTNNLLYDFSQTTIPTDNVDPDFLEAPRRWGIDNIVRFILFVGPISSIFDYITYAIMFFVFGASTPAQASLFQTGWFVESLLSQTLVIHIIRTARKPFVESRPSLPLIATTVAICIAGIWLPYSSLGALLGFAPLPPAYWPMMIALLLCYMTLTYFMKQWFHRRFGIG